MNTCGKCHKEQNLTAPRYARVTAGFGGYYVLYVCEECYKCEGADHPPKDPKDLKKGPFGQYYVDGQWLCTGCTYGNMFRKINEAKKKTDGIITKSKRARNREALPRD